MGDRNSRTYLSDLAADIETQLQFRTTMSDSFGSEPVLIVRNPLASDLNERIQVDDGRFLWSWGQPICPVTERATALLLIRKVLSGVEAP